MSIDMALCLAIISFVGVVAILITMMGGDRDGN
jgi:multisubunit Na+/H+ antiporter MnhF subunit